MFRSILSAGILAAVGCLALQAQGVHMKATIPFEFAVGRSAMPAGEYSIFLQYANVVRLRCNTTPGKVAFVLVTHSAPDRGPNSALTFRRYGNEYFLASIWRHGSLDSITVPRSKVDREVAARHASRATVALAAK